MADGRRVPAVFVGGRFDQEPVIARRQVRVDRRPPRAGVDPVGVEAVEPVAEADPVRAASAPPPCSRCPRVWCRRGNVVSGRRPRSGARRPSRPRSAPAPGAIDGHRRDRTRIDDGQRRRPGRTTTCRRRPGPIGRCGAARPPGRPTCRRTGSGCDAPDSAATLSISATAIRMMPTSRLTQIVVVRVLDNRRRAAGRQAVGPRDGREPSTANRLRPALVVPRSNRPCAPTTRMMVVAPAPNVSRREHAERLALHQPEPRARIAEPQPARARLLCAQGALGCAGRRRERHESPLSQCTSLLASPSHMPPLGSGDRQVMLPIPSSAGMSNGCSRPSTVCITRPSIPDPHSWPGTIEPDRPNIRAAGPGRRRCALPARSATAARRRSWCRPRARRRAPRRR